MSAGERTDPSPRALVGHHCRSGPTRRRGGLAVLGLLVATVTLAGCAAISPLLDTDQALRDAGYQSVGVNYDFTSSGDGLKVSVAVSAPATQSAVHDVAQVVWQKFHERFAFLHITVHGTGPAQTGDFTFADLQSSFGPRNPDWNKTSIGQSAEHLGLEIVIGIVVVIAVVVVVVVVAIRRKRRRRPPGFGGRGPGVPLWPAPPGPPWAPWTEPPPPGYQPPPQYQPPPRYQPPVANEPPAGDGGWGPPRPPA